MGSLFSSPDPLKVVVVGLDNSGKSSILKRMQATEDVLPPAYQLLGTDVAPAGPDHRSYTDRGIHFRRVRARRLHIQSVGYVRFPRDVHMNLARQLPYL
jgi:hypothetical protein